MNDQFYIYEDGKVRVATLDEWARWMVDADRRVAETFVDDLRVSTVFVGLNMSKGVGKPLMFETMIFQGVSFMDHYCVLSATVEEALEQHEHAVLLAQRVVEQLEKEDVKDESDDSNRVASSDTNDSEC